MRSVNQALVHACGGRCVTLSYMPSAYSAWSLVLAQVAKLFYEGLNLEGLFPFLGCEELRLGLGLVLGSALGLGLGLGLGLVLGSNLGLCKRVGLQFAVYRRVLGGHLAV